jgi:hypothetical protein
LVKERGRYELFCVGGLYGRSTKTILDFEVKFFGCCSIEFGIQSLVGAPNGFNIIQSGLKMRKIWHLKLEKV